MKILVLANNCFAKNNSNGRILGCLFKHFNPNDVYQFYTAQGANDWSVCSHYYMVTDKMVIRSLYSRKGIGECPERSQQQAQIAKFSEMRARFGKSYPTMLMRDILWGLYTWWTKQFDEWLEQTQADVIILQCGDAAFMYRIARRVAKKLNKPLVLFNTECYYFYKDSWLGENVNTFGFHLVRHRLHKAIDKLMPIAEMSVYNSEYLRSLYQTKFNRPSTFIYQSSDYSAKYCPTPAARQMSIPPKIVYIGNLTFCRHEALIDIASALHTINPNYVLQVYGLASDEVEKQFRQTAGLYYGGVISYNEVVDKLKDSDILVMAENSDPYYARTIQYGFSTKITDYLFTGKPIFAYGPADNTGMAYLRDHQAAMVVSDKTALAQNLSQLLTDQTLRERIVGNALSLAKQNHDADKNAEKFKSIIQTVVTQNMCCK